MDQAAPPKLMISTLPELYEGMKPNERVLKPEHHKQVLRTLAKELGTTEKAVLHRLAEGQQLKYRHYLYRDSVTVTVRQVIAKAKRKEAEKC